VWSDFGRRGLSKAKSAAKEVSHASSRSRGNVGEPSAPMNSTKESDMSPLSAHEIDRTLRVYERTFSLASELRFKRHF
jgi:hypothetical protein